MMRLPLYQVDAFAREVFTGNPAALCPLESWLPDGTLQSIATENNLSETAFLVPAGEGFELRWFTPRSEVDLCGHATLAAAFLVFERLRPGTDEVRFQTRSGELRVTRREGLLEMDLPALPAAPCQAPEEVLAGLPRRPREILVNATKYFAVYDEPETVRDMVPDLDPFAGLPDREGVVVTAPGRDCDFVSRFFAPAVGVPEDPVCGSAHCALVPYWASVLGRRELHARQLSPRGGELLCRLEGDRVHVAGPAVLYLEGEILVPSPQPARA